MANITLSEAEKNFIVQGIQNDYRNDGRSRKDFRPIELETNIVSNASGSARLRLANSDVIVCVKAEICTPDPFAPNKGKLEIFVDCSANATPEFEGRGGEDLAYEISSTLLNSYKASNAFDYDSLCLIPGQQCWKIYVDILILECGGNLFDAVSLAVKSALFNTKLPNLTAETLDGELKECVLTDNPLDIIRINIDSLPLLVTVCKIGNHFIIDPSAEEEECSSVSIVIGVCQCNGKDFITTVHTYGEGSFTTNSLNSSIELGMSSVKHLNSFLINALKLEETKYNEFGKKKVYGFLK